MTQADLNGVRRAAARVATAECALDRAMAKAQASGESLRDIGKAAGFGHQKVSDRLKAVDGSRGRPHSDERHGPHSQGIGRTVTE